MVCHRLMRTSVLRNRWAYAQIIPFAQIYHNSDCPNLGKAHLCFILFIRTSSPRIPSLLKDAPHLLFSTLPVRCPAVRSGTFFSSGVFRPVETESPSTCAVPRRGSVHLAVLFARQATSLRVRRARPPWKMLRWQLAIQKIQDHLPRRSRTHVAAPARRRSGQEGRESCARGWE